MNKKTNKQEQQRLQEALDVLNALQDEEVDAILGKSNLSVLRIREVERNLREAEEKLRVLVEAAAQAVWETSPQGEVEEDNPGWRAYTGQSREEFLQPDGWLQAVHPDDRRKVARAWKKALASQENFNLEFQLRSADGTWRWTHVHAAPVRAEDGDIVKWVGMNIDITQRKRAEERILRLNEKLEQLVVERTAEVRRQATRLRALASQLSKVESQERKRLAMILHDHIQQLMAVARIQVEGFANFDHSEKVSDKVNGALKTLDEAIAASRALTVDLYPPALHEGGLVDGLRWLARNMKEKHGFTIDLQADERDEPISEDMRFLFFECARELLLNTLKHSGEKSARIRLFREKEGRINLLVADQGAGFDIEEWRQQDNIKQSFGLFSIQERLVHLGGSMEISAAKGEGVAVELTAPSETRVPEIRETWPAEQKREAVAKKKKPCSEATCRVLVVDDHQIMREGLIELLQLDSTIEVVGEAADGPQAIELAASLEPNIVIMDVNLGQMSGFEATRRILERNPEIKVIGLSMHTDPSVVAGMREAGAVDYLSKGTASRDLVTAVKHWCQQ